MKYFKDSKADELNSTSLHISAQLLFRKKSKLCIPTYMMLLYTTFSTLDIFDKLSQSVFKVTQDYIMG